MTYNESLPDKNYMDGRLMRLLHGNLHRLSAKNFEKLKRYYEGGTLSLEDQNSLLNEITAHRDMSRVHPLLD
jgi:hypothetical protein